MGFNINFIGLNGAKLYFDSLTIKRSLRNKARARRIPLVCKKTTAIRMFERTQQIFSHFWQNWCQRCEGKYLNFLA